MRQNNNKIMILIIGLLLLIIIILLVYYNYDRFKGDDAGIQPVDTEEPAGLQPEPKPSANPSKPGTITPGLDEVDSLNMDTELEEPEADTLSTEDNTPGIEPSTAPSDAAFLHIPHTRSIFNTYIESVESLPSSKLYYQSSRGKIESLVLSNGGNEKIEQLITYDRDGNKLDNLEIGLIDNEGKRTKYAVVYQNKVSTYTLSHNKNNKEQETVTEYTITNDLRFIKGKTYTKIL